MRCMIHELSSFLPLLFGISYIFKKFLLIFLFFPFWILDLFAKYPGEKEDCQKIAIESIPFSFLLLLYLLLASAKIFLFLFSLIIYKSSTTNNMGLSLKNRERKFQ